MEAEGTAMLEAAKMPAGQRQLQRFADVRYRRQAYELTVPMADGPITADTVALLAEAFHRRHEQTYGHSNAREPVQIVNIRVTALGKRPALTLAQPGRAEATRAATREVWFPYIGFVATTVLWREGLAEGAAIDGPAIIESLESTVVVPPGWSARVDASGFLIAGKRSHTHA